MSLVMFLVFSQYRLGFKFGINFQTPIYSLTPDCIL